MVQIEGDPSLERQRYRALVRRLDRLRHHDLKVIAGSLKDAVGNELAELCRSIATLMNADDPIKAVDRAALVQLSQAAEQAHSNLRRISYEICPPGPDELGLTAALQRCITEFEGQTGIAAEFRIVGRMPAVNRHSQLILHRIVEEALANVARHSKARRVELKLAAERGVLTATIRDDGCGITQRDRQKPDALGLLTMSERLAEVGGTLRIIGEAGKGTTLQAGIPIA